MDGGISLWQLVEARAGVSGAGPIVVTEHRFAAPSRSAWLDQVDALGKDTIAVLRPEAPQ